MRRCYVVKRVRPFCIISHPGEIAFQDFTGQAEFTENTEIFSLPLRNAAKKNGQSLHDIKKTAHRALWLLFFAFLKVPQKAGAAENNKITTSASSAP